EEHRHVRPFKALRRLEEQIKVVYKDDELSGHTLCGSAGFHPFVDWLQIVPFHLEDAGVPLFALTNFDKRSNELGILRVELGVNPAQDLEKGSPAGPPFSVEHDRPGPEQISCMYPVTDVCDLFITKADTVARAGHFHR